jgi:hypothetical protein
LRCGEHSLFFAPSRSAISNLKKNNTLHRRRDYKIPQLDKSLLPAPSELGFPLLSAMETYVLCYRIILALAALIEAVAHLLNALRT